MVILDDCAIVCTVFPREAKSSFTDDASDVKGGRSVPPSGAQVYGQIGRYAVLRPATIKGSRVTRLWSKLPDLYERANPIDLPRRACTACGRPLPEEIDELDVLVLAVVGLNRGGKSYFIGSALTAASRNEGLAEFGVEAFTPLEDTATRLHSFYYSQLFRGNFGLNATPVGDHLTTPPLTFRVTMTGGHAFVLMVHDVSGEDLMDRSSRAATASFVSRADAIIFLADPTDMHRIEQNLPRDVLTASGGGALRNLDQASLLDAVLHELRPTEPGRLPPLAVAISKSDLLVRAMKSGSVTSVSPSGEATVGNDLEFFQPRAGEDWRAEVTASSEKIKQLLMDLNENKLVSLAERHHPSSFHAISVLGSAEARSASGGRPVPVRVMDPLGTVLEQLRLGRARAD